MQFKGEHRPPMPQIAKTPNVDAVVEGSVLRTGDRLRITAQLIDAQNDEHLWAKSFERDSRDALALQDELASAIANEIKVELSPPERARLATARTVNSDAHDAYLAGRFYLGNPTVERVNKAVEEFQRAIKIDPAFPLAYAGLAEAYAWAMTFRLVLPSWASQDCRAEGSRSGRST
jgi:adenylate cyclase